MNWFRRVMTVTLAAFWLLAINHCKLEQIPGLSFLSCCEQDDGAPTKDKDCETDGCAAVESGFYKMEDGQPFVSAPSLVALTLWLPLPSVQLLPASTSHVKLEAAPPELPVTWQFSHRAAVSPRAPSSVS